MLLDVENLTVHYGKIAGVRNVTLQVQDGAIVTIIGANGAGKSTMLRAISGLEKPSSGEIRLRDKRIDGLPAEQIVAMGIAHVPEGRRVFPDLTVSENLYTGAFLRKDKHSVRQDLHGIFELFPVLRARRSQWAKTLSGGEQQMLAIGRAMMTKPSLLLLDEPSMGLAPLMVQEIVNIISRINEQGVSVVLVEQNSEIALRLSHYAYVLETGTVSLHGPAKQLHEDEHVQKAYLGM